MTMPHRTEQQSAQHVEIPPWHHEEGTGLRVTAVRVMTTAPAGTPLAIVRIDTNVPGLYGLGCASSPMRLTAVVRAIEDYLAPQLIGRDPGDVTDIWQTMNHSGYWRSGVVQNNAIAGIDIALWDILGKHLGVPVYQLFGGRVRHAIPVYGHADGMTPAEVVDHAREFLAKGYRYLRCQVGVAGAENYGVHQAAAGGQHRRPWIPDDYARAVPVMFEHVRAELGEEVALLHDVHERLAPIDAVRLAKDLEPYRLFFLEDLLAPEDVEYFRTVRTQSATPIAMGELFANVRDFLPLVEERLIDFARIRLCALAGITPVRTLIACCAAYGVRTALHGPGDVSPVGHAANLHLDIATTNFGIQEQVDFPDVVREVFPGTVEIHQGHVTPHPRPGLGIDIDEHAAARYPITDPPAGQRWARIRLPDGTAVPA